MKKLNYTKLSGWILPCSLAFASLGAAAQTTPTPASSDLPDAPSTTAHEVPPALPSGPTVIFDTTMGRLTCKLFSKEAPTTVAAFIGLVKGTKTWTDPKSLKQMVATPFYDGTTFHRVIPGFMIQGGDRLERGTRDFICRTRSPRRCGSMFRAGWRWRTRGRGPTAVSSSSPKIRSRS
jgi:hypothetical protein